MRLEHYPHILAEDAKFLELLKQRNKTAFEYFRDKIPWRQVIWRDRPMKRLTAQWTRSEMARDPLFARLVEFLEKRFDLIIRSVWCNYYRSGEDFTPFHTDQYNCLVVSVSFGATRDFIFRPTRKGGDNGAAEKHYRLSDGDVFIFDEEANDKYRHSVPRQPEVKEGRINFTIFADRKPPPG
eukprot:GEZU01010102.1.p1 GENE.GEZU01010102.1~~GEZU01010102.1.p1  ORF type:complete len:182 (+),score=47.94 GEZU01010102.1:298-843(+)